MMLTEQQRKVINDTAERIAWAVWNDTNDTVTEVVDIEAIVRPYLEELVLKTGVSE